MITDDQRRRRQGKIGSSDAAAVLTTDARPIDPYRTRVDLWAQLTGRVAPVKTNAAMLAGKYVEVGLLQYAADTLGAAVTPHRMYEHPDEVRVANTDGLAIDLATVVECKTAGLLGPLVDDGWRDDGDRVPLHVIVQVHHQLAVLDAQPDLPRFEKIAVATLLGRKGLRLFWVARDDELVEGIAEEEARFWRDFVVANRQPPDLPRAETLRAWRRDPELPTVALPTDRVAAWDAARRRRLEDEKDEKLTWRHVVTALGDAERGTCALGTVTYEPDARGVRTLRLSQPKRGRRAA